MSYAYFLRFHMTSAAAADFVAWFQSQNGTLDSSSMGIVDFPGHGRGAIALKDIPVRLARTFLCIGKLIMDNFSQEDHVLFSLPRDLSLSTRTCALPALMGGDWRAHGLHEGWVGLILCMMWEESRGAASKWSGYLGTSFLRLLRGVCVRVPTGWTRSGPAGEV